MDIKFKGVSWVGGIYQKFETLYHEVDNIMNQGTVKYVENQTQTVGKSMKRFYSDVMHDILPPLKYEGQGVALKRSVTIDTSVISKAAIEEDHIETVGRLSYVEPVAVDPFEKQLDYVSSELCLSDQLGTPNSTDALEGAESDIMSGQLTDDLKTGPSLNVEENATMENASVFVVLELISPCEQESFGASLANEFIDCNNKNSSGFADEVSPTILVHDTEFQSHQEEGTVNNNIAVHVVKKQLDSAFGELCLVDQLGDPDSVDSLMGTEYLTSKQVSDVLKDAKPEVNIEETTIMEKPSVSEMAELISPAEKESFGALLSSEHINCNDKEPCWVQAKVSLATLVDKVTKPSGCDVPQLIFPGEESFGGLVHEFVNYNDKNPCVVRTDGSPATSVHGDQNARTVKNGFADDSLCVSDAAYSKMTSSLILHKENMAKVGVDASCGSALKEYYFPENLPENSPAKALIYHNHINAAELVSHNVHSSPTLLPLPSNEKKLMEAISIPSSSDLSMQSLDNDASTTVDCIESLTGILGNQNVYFRSESAQFRASSSSDIGPIDDSTYDISSMETIELSDKVKLADSCVILDSTALLAVSRIMRKHRSYKKRIQDALTSKKRLAKEYEQLAIRFGDADMVSNLEYLQTIRRSPSGTNLEFKNLQTEVNCDSEWELL